jgi:hypothetical protein
MISIKRIIFWYGGSIIYIKLNLVGFFDDLLF